MADVDFRALVEGAADVVAVLDRDHRYVFANPALVLASGHPIAWLIGKRNDEVVPPEVAEMWREAINHVLATGEERWIERTIDTPGGRRRFSARLIRLPGDLVCIVTRDVTELRAEKLLTTAAQTLPLGLCVVEAPSGRVVFRNDRTEEIFGPIGVVSGVDEYAAIPSWDMAGEELSAQARPLARALRGELVVDEVVRIIRDDGEFRAVRINAAPVRSAVGDVTAAVATYSDITDHQRAHEAATFLASVGAVLENFDDTSGLQRIADLAAPAIADWAYIHMKVGDEVVTDAIGHRDPEAAATARKLAASHRQIGAETAVARVLAGGPPELVRVDEPTLAAAARDGEHLDQLRTQGYRSAVVAPLVTRGEVFGAITLVRAGSPRRFDAQDLQLITELARRIGVAVENARLFRAEREARNRAEQANDRTRRLQQLTVQLSHAITEAEVVSCVVVAGRDAAGAAAGFGWLLRDADALELTAHADASGATHLARYQRIPLAAHLPACQVVRDGQPLLFETLDDMLAAFPDAMRRDETPYRAWAVIPFVANGRAIGVASFSFDRQRAFSADDRELLAAMTGQAALALDRCQLLADIHLARRRERELYALAAKLSSSLTADQIARTVATEVTQALGARVGSTMILDGDHGIRFAHSGPLVDARPDRFPLDMRTPSTDATRTGELVWCASIAEIRARYPHMEALRAENDLAAWGAVPFAFEQRTVGALAIAFSTPHPLRADEREFLEAAGQLAGQALERARLYDELRSKDERLRTAIRAGRGGSWTVDVRRMTTQRDPSFAALLGLRPDVLEAADFALIHPDDRDTARVAFARTRAEGMPYEPEVRLRKGDGTYLWTRSYGQLVHDAAGPAFLTGITFDIDDAKRASLALEQAVATAREADQRKDEFLAMLGHELRNPLAPIATALELMDLKVVGVAQRERDVIRRQVGHLSRLIDDLLDVSRITRGKVQLAKSIVELGGVLAKAVEMASPLLEKRAHQLALDVPRTGLLVDADPTRLAQVFQNLLTNAAKYTEPRGHIAVRARATDEEIVVDVSDDGIGIPGELLPHLFELFRQGERAIDRADGGLGIGLTVARSLCELHGGSISATSAGPDQGSTFTVRLPRAVAPTGLATVADALPRRATKRARVLVVDDNIDAAVMLHAYLAHLGHDLAIAHDGPSALELARTFEPEIALLDIGLPVMDGYELARKLREQFGAGLRLVAVTGYGQESDRARAKAAGFDHHVVKPIELEQLTRWLDG